jgi:alpha-N-arabinofuranosidase
VDEWGSWYTTEPGSRPNELYQQQTVRDAVLAALTLNVFINHAERVRMANIAQMVNVLQAMILTFGQDIVLTPSWHVFKLYAPHQDATRLEIKSDAPDRLYQKYPYPSVSAAASRADDQSVCISLTNTDPAEPVSIVLNLEGLHPLVGPTGEIITAPILTACNTPEAPDQVSSRAWKEFTWSGQTLKAELPPASVATLTFAKSS